MQEVITLSVFAVFSVLYLGERFTAQSSDWLWLDRARRLLRLQGPVRRRLLAFGLAPLYARRRAGFLNAASLHRRYRRPGRPPRAHRNSAGPAPCLAARLRRRQRRECRRRLRHYRGDPRRFSCTRGRLRDARQSRFRSARSLEFHRRISRASCARRIFRPARRVAAPRWSRRRPGRACSSSISWAGCSWTRSTILSLPASGNRRLSVGRGLRCGHRRFSCRGDK